MTKEDLIQAVEDMTAPELKELIDIITERLGLNGKSEPKSEAGGVGV